MKKLLSMVALLSGVAVATAMSAGTATGVSATSLTPLGAAALPVALTAATTSDRLVTVVSDFGDLSRPRLRFADVLSGEGKQYLVATPPGMATNGGIVVATLGSTRTAALLPSQLLRFTPFARSTAHAEWLPGVTESLVARHPDAVAEAGRGIDLVDERGVLRTSTDLEHWKKVATPLPQWAKQARCKLRAVASGRGTAKPVLGLSCKAPTRSLVAVGETSLATGANTPRQLLRLQATDHGYVAVTSMPALGRVTIDQFNEALTVTSSVSAAIGNIRATAVHHEGSVVLLGTRGDREVVATIEGNSVRVVKAPKRARAVVLSLSGQTQVLSVIDHVRTEQASLVTVRSWNGQRWSVTGRFGVPVPYGSSM